MCPSSGELIVSVRHLLYVTVYRWPFGVQVWMSLIQTCTPNGHLYRVTYTRCRIDTINSPDDGHMAAPKHVENRNKHTWKRIVRQVGYLRRLYRDAARSTEHKKQWKVLANLSLNRFYWFRNPKWSSNGTALYLLNSCVQNRPMKRGTC